MPCKGCGKDCKCTADKCHDNCKCEKGNKCHCGDATSKEGGEAKKSCCSKAKADN